MSQPPPAKPKLTAAEQRQRREDRIACIQRLAIGQALDARGMTDPAAIGEALGMPAQEAVKLLNHRQWREGDVALLQAAAAQLGVHVLD
jgi:hypothetical protein